MEYDHEHCFVACGCPCKHMRREALSSRRERKAKGEPVFMETQIEIPMDGMITITKGSNY